MLVIVGLDQLSKYLIVSHFGMIEQIYIQNLEIGASTIIGGIEFDVTTNRTGGNIVGVSAGDHLFIADAVYSLQRTVCTYHKLADREGVGKPKAYLACPFA